MHATENSTENLFQFESSLKKTGALALKGSVAFWLTITLLGQWAFFYYIIAFYGIPVLHGDISQWNEQVLLKTEPYVVTEPFNAFAFGAHAFGAAIIAFGGILQLIPVIRRRFPKFHRINGRVFLLTVLGLSLSGFYLTWVRGPVPESVSEFGTSANGILILIFAGLTTHYAVRRQIQFHERWAIRLYLVSNAQWFLRIAAFGYFAIGSALGAEVEFSGPYFEFIVWGCFIVPLAGLEIFLYARDHRSNLVHWGAASVISLFTLFMCVGIFAFVSFSQLLISGAELSM